MSAMSEQDIDQLVGRLIREKGEAMRRRAAIDQELQVIQRTVEAAFAAMTTALGTPASQIALLEPISKYFAIEPLRELLLERTELHRCVADRIRQLRELGIGD